MKNVDADSITSMADAVAAWATTDMDTLRDIS